NHCRSRDRNRRLHRTLPPGGAAVGETHPYPADRFLDFGVRAMTEGNSCGVNDLLDTFGLLAASMLDDPLLALANAVCWLDPLWEFADDDVYDEGDGVGMALCITRSAFPDIYAGAVERIRSG